MCRDSGGTGIGRTPEAAREQAKSNARARTAQMELEAAKLNAETQAKKIEAGAQAKPKAKARTKRGTAVDVAPVKLAHSPHLNDAAYSERAQGMEPLIVAPTQKLKPYDEYAHELRTQNPDRTQTWIARQLSAQFRLVISQGEVSKSLRRIDTFIAQGGQRPELKPPEPGPRPRTMNNLDGIAQTTEPVPGESL